MIFWRGTQDFFNSLPGGATTISGSYNQTESDRTTYATIGGLNSALTSETKDILNADFEGSLTVDHRLFTKEGRESILSDFTSLGQNLKTMRTAGENSPLGIGAILNTPNTLLEGAIYTFSEKKEDAPLVKATYDPNDPWAYKLTTITDPAEGKNYVVNGVNTSQNLDGYFLSKDQSSDLIARYNPTHGLFGDVVESGLTKIFNAAGNPEAIAMNRIVTEDMYGRRNIPGATNTFVSEGTIFGIGAMQLYSKTFQRGVDLNGNAVSGSTAIDSSQRFVAVAPAVMEGDWRGAVENKLNLDPEANAVWKQDPLDSIRHLTAPNNLINDTAKLFGRNINSPIYIPNPLSTSTGIGLGTYDLLNGGGINNPHSISNPLYSKYLRNNQGQ